MTHLEQVLLHVLILTRTQLAQTWLHMQMRTAESLFCTQQKMQLPQTQRHLQQLSKQQTTQNMQPFTILGCKFPQRLPVLLVSFRQLDMLLVSVQMHTTKQVHIYQPLV
jgi:anion-transporting  ArsA/GET3 family ATPase